MGSRRSAKTVSWYQRSFFCLDQHTQSFQTSTTQLCVYQCGISTWSWVNPSSLHFVQTGLLIGKIHKDQGQAYLLAGLCRGDGQDKLQSLLDQSAQVSESLIAGEALLVLLSDDWNGNSWCSKEAFVAKLSVQLCLMHSHGQPEILCIFCDWQQRRSVIVAIKCKDDYDFWVAITGLHVIGFFRLGSAEKSAFAQLPKFADACKKDAGYST